MAPADAVLQSSVLPQDGRVDEEHVSRARHRGEDAVGRRVTCR